MRGKNRESLADIHAFSQSVLFRQIWLMCDRRSYLSGLWLRDYVNTPQFPSLFAHVLAKGQNQFPHFTLYARNLITLTPLEHKLLDEGTKEERISYSKRVKTADWGRIRDLRADLKDEYEKHFPSTKDGILNYRYSHEEVAQVLRKINKEYWISFERMKGGGK